MTVAFRWLSTIRIVALSSKGNPMTQPDVYLLGRGKAEELRLKRQIADLAPLSDPQLAEVGIKA